MYGSSGVSERFSLGCQSNPMVSFHGCGFFFFTQGNLYQSIYLLEKTWSKNLDLNLNFFLHIFTFVDNIPYGIPIFKVSGFFFERWYMYTVKVVSQIPVSWNQDSAKRNSPGRGGGALWNLAKSRSDYTLIISLYR